MKSEFTVVINGGSLTLTADVNIFKLSEKDRDFILELKGLMDKLSVKVAPEVTE